MSAAESWSPGQSKFTAERVERYLEALREGMTLTQAAVAIDTYAGTVEEWRAKDAGFDERVKLVIASRSRSITAEKIERFVCEVESGATTDAAARAAGIAKSSHQYWINKDPALAARYAAAVAKRRAVRQASRAAAAVSARAARPTYYQRDMTPDVVEAVVELILSGRTQQSAVREVVGRRGRGNAFMEWKREGSDGARRIDEAIASVSRAKFTPAARERYVAALAAGWAKKRAAAEAGVNQSVVRGWTQAPFASVEQERFASAAATAWEQGKAVREAPNSERRTRYDYSLRRGYGIGIDVAEALLETQRGECGICETQIRFYAGAGGETSAVVDHSHKTGAVRGVLCARCNSGIGFLNDDPHTLARASIYIANDGVSVEDSHLSAAALMRVIETQSKAISRLERAARRMRETHHKRRQKGIEYAVALPDGWLSIPDVGRMLGVCGRTARRFAQGGEFSGAQRIGSRWRVPQSAVAVYLMARVTGGSAATEGPPPG